MPELPEVETIVRQVRLQIMNRKIEQIDIRRSSQWKQNDVIDVGVRLAGRSFIAVDRRAKFIVFSMDDGQQLIVHLRMSGKLFLADDWQPIDDYTRTIWQFADGGSLQFSDTRALGTLELLFPGEMSERLRTLGVEPLSSDFQFKPFREMLAKSQMPIKVFLLDQKKVVGIGNIYANETLFRTGIHPLRPANTLDEQEAQALFNTIPKVLHTAIDHMGTTLGNNPSDYRTVYSIDGGFQTLLKVYGREGEPCYTCGSVIERLVHGGRSSFVCPQCQSWI